ncbi:DUF192 domain-containing protein [Anianabacter salinae]|uniref:DUF192 domain-containing protein n=1 Tax=Anianabacter salinae TaxID=2851023 RepID=UPI00225E1E1A|nr:DUF192 domain-containing protein [Anianabacter salinae]MBV0911572.1 DUF192 domain-containing protein [Anianabacter salinae]
MMGAGSAQADCAFDQVEVRGNGSSARFTVDVADDNAERGQGLMFVEEMARSRGMLFVFDQPQPVSFWMRNTLIPLDMIFVGADGVVRSVHENATPLDESSIFGGNDIQYVLEINGGLAQRLGIGPGSELRHPSMDQDAAAWACADG